MAKDGKVAKKTGRRSGNSYKKAVYRGYAGKGNLVRQFKKSMRRYIRHCTFDELGQQPGNHKKMKFPCTTDYWWMMQDFVSDARFNNELCTDIYSHHWQASDGTFVVSK